MITKQQQRQIAYDVRNLQPNKDVLSKKICQQVIDDSIYQSSDTVMWYVHCRSEVRTIDALKNVLKDTKRIVVPYCTKDKNERNCLGLWLLEDFSELVPGTWGILEPPVSRWGETEKNVQPEALDFIVVPGVAFDVSGGRLGNGAGYYDRLLNAVRDDTHLMAIGYESQLCEQVLMDKYDVYMDCVLTEKNKYYRDH